MKQKNVQTAAQKWWKVVKKIFTGFLLQNFFCYIANPILKTIKSIVGPRSDLELAYLNDK